MCPGFHVAERGLFIAASRLLWGFSFSHALDQSGQIIPIDRDAMTDGFIVRPEPYLFAFSMIDCRDEQMTDLQTGVPFPFDTQGVLTLFAKG